MSDFLNKLKNGAEELGVILSDEQLEKFNIFYKTLVKWNKKINLTAVTEEDEVLIKHFLDSLLVAKVSEPDSWENMLDLGTGAGFPGIPLKIAYPSLKMTLVDSTRKKIDFVNHVIQELGLKDIEGVHSRAEELGKDPEYREKYNIVTARAVASLAVLSEYCLPFVKVGGKMLAFKSKEIEAEVETAQMAIKKLGGKIENVSRETIPFSDIERSFVSIKKITNTPAKFPRRVGIPKKKPLK